MMVCPSCGVAVTPGPARCQHCGASLHPLGGHWRRRLSIGAGLTTLVALPFTLLGIVGTQGMHGTESLGALLAFFAWTILMPYAGAALLFLLPAATTGEGRHGYWIGVAAFAAGGALAAIAAALAMEAGMFMIFTALPIVLLPALIGWLGVREAQRPL